MRRESLCSLELLGADLLVITERLTHWDVDASSEVSWISSSTGALMLGALVDLLARATPPRRAGDDLAAVVTTSAHLRRALLWQSIDPQDPAFVSSQAPVLEWSWSRHCLDFRLPLAVGDELPTGGAAVLTHLSSRWDIKGSGRLRHLLMELTPQSLPAGMHALRAGADERDGLAVRLFEAARLERLGHGILSLAIACDRLARAPAPMSAESVALPEESARVIACLVGALTDATIWRSSPDDTPTWTLHQGAAEPSLVARCTLRQACVGDAPGGEEMLRLFSERWELIGSIGGRDLEVELTPASVARGLLRQAAILAIPEQADSGKISHLDSLDLSELDIDPDLIARVPSELARSYHLLPFGRFESTLLIAMTNPSDPAVLRILQAETGFSVEGFVASKENIDGALDRYYPSVGGGDGRRTEADSVVKK